MRLPPAIIDTNVLVSGIISGHADAPTCRIVDGMLDGAFSFVLSVALLREYREVLLRPTIARIHKLNEAGVDEILESIVVNAIILDPPACSNPAPDRNDQHLWNLLAMERGTILITGDAMLLAHPPSHARVISPRSFVEWMQDIQKSGV